MSRIFAPVHSNVPHGDSEKKRRKLSPESLSSHLRISGPAAKELSIEGTYYIHCEPSWSSVAYVKSTYNGFFAVFKPSGSASDPGVRSEFWYVASSWESEDYICFCRSDSLKAPSEGLWETKTGNKIQLEIKFAPLELSQFLNRKHLDINSMMKHDLVRNCLHNAFLELLNQRSDHDETLANIITFFHSRRKGPLDFEFDSALWLSKNNLLKMENIFLFEEVKYCVQFGPFENASLAVKGGFLLMTVCIIKEIQFPPVATLTDRDEIQQHFGGICGAAEEAADTIGTLVVLDLFPENINAWENYHTCKAAIDLLKSVQVAIRKQTQPTSS